MIQVYVAGCCSRSGDTQSPLWPPVGALEGADASGERPLPELLWLPANKRTVLLMTRGGTQLNSNLCKLSIRAWRRSPTSYDAAVNTAGRAYRSSKPLTPAGVGVGALARRGRRPTWRADAVTGVVRARSLPRAPPACLCYLCRALPCLSARESAPALWLQGMWLQAPMASRLQSQVCQQRMALQPLARSHRAAARCPQHCQHLRL